MRTAIETMLTMQNQMNTKVHEDWVNQGFEWYRAVWIECGELMDHIGYKWWKHQVPDMPQVLLEIVDIWHFGLSALFTPDTDIPALAGKIEVELYHAEPETSDLKLATEALAQDSLATRSFSVSKFLQLMLAAGMSFDELYRHYVGKNVLNFFRQDHGYKDGSYIKVWGGREDNEHLSEIIEELVIADADFPKHVYDALTARYPG